VAQAGFWDVDGTGLKEIEDEALAKRIRDKARLAAFALAHPRTPLPFYPLLPPNVA